MILDEIVFVFCSLFATSSLQRSLCGQRMYRGDNVQVETYYISDCCHIYVPYCDNSHGVGDSKRESLFITQTQMVEW